MKDTKDSSKTTLKSRNFAWLIGTLVFDCLLLLIWAFQTPLDNSLQAKMILIRGSLTTALPIPVLFLSSLLSADLKAKLVFWRIKYPLPGSQAFSKYAQADHRIDLAALKKNIGEFPISERDQNSKWYGLYKQVQSDTSVVDSHKNYLLFRDIAAMSLLLVPVVPLVMYLSNVAEKSILICTSWFLIQFFLAAYAARTNGIRFVQNVLAVHASKK